MEFLQRISLLIKLQNCWTKGHSDIKLQCSSDDDCAGDVCQLSLEFSSDNNLLQPAIEEIPGSSYIPEGNCCNVTEVCVFVMRICFGCSLSI